MIQDTSFQAFSKVQPKINRRQQEILQVIREHPEGLTDAEINHYLGWTINRVTPPRGDLMERKENDLKERIRLGLIYEAGVRICRKNHNPAKAAIKQETSPCRRHSKSRPTRKIRPTHKHCFNNLFVGTKDAIEQRV